MDFNKKEKDLDRERDLEYINNKSMINQDKIDKMNNNNNKKSNDGLSSQSFEANVTINPSE
jgi:hypothetical protein